MMMMETRQVMRPYLLRSLRLCQMCQSTSQKAQTVNEFRASSARLEGYWLRKFERVGG